MSWTGSTSSAGSASSLVQLRRDLQRRPHQDRPPAWEQSLYRSRCLLLKRGDRLNEAEHAKLRTLFDRYPALETGWQALQELHQVYQASNLEEALIALDRFTALYQTGEIPQYRKTVKTILRWSDQILAYHTTGQSRQRQNRSRQQPTPKTPTHRPRPRQPPKLRQPRPPANLTMNTDQNPTPIENGEEPVFFSLMVLDNFTACAKVDDMTTNSYSDNRSATRFKTVVTFFNSLLPLALGVSNAGANPLGLATVLGFGVSIVLAIFLLLRKRYRKYSSSEELKNFIQQLRGVEEKFYRNDKGAIRRFWHKHVFLVSLIGKFGILFYLFGNKFIDTNVVAILFVTQAIFLVWLKRFDAKKANLKERRILLKGRLWLLILIILFGLGYVYLLKNNGSFGINEGYGIILVLFAGFLDAINIDRSLIFGEIQFSRDQANKRSLEDKQIVYSVIFIAITNFIMGIIVGLIIAVQTLFTNQNFSDNFQFNSKDFSHSLLFIILFALLFGIPLLFLRMANHIKPNINATALLWILIFYEINFARPDIFITGTILLLATNTVLQKRSLVSDRIEEGKDKYDLTALVLSFGSVVIIVLYRILYEDRILESWIDQWQWRGTTDFISQMRLSLFVFFLTLISEESLEKMKQYLNRSSRVTSRYWFDIWFPLLGCGFLVFTFVVILYGRDWMIGWIS